MISGFGLLDSLRRKPRRNGAHAGSKHRASQCSRWAKHRCADSPSREGAEAGPDAGTYCSSNARADLRGFFDGVALGHGWLKAPGISHFSGQAAFRREQLLTGA
jgi:hypothetical protein